MLFPPEDSRAADARWSRLGGLTRRWSWLVGFTGLILTVAAVGLIVRPEWGFLQKYPGSSSISLDTGVSGGSSTSSDEYASIPQAGPDGAGSRPMTGGGRLTTTVLGVDEDGVLLTSAGRDTISSPSGTYKLSLQPDGDLVLSRLDEALGAVPVWWTATGDNRTPAGHNVTITTTPDGRPLLSVGAKLGGQWRTIWHSDLEPACRTPPTPAEADDRGDSLDRRGAARALSLSDSGVLRLAGLCDLFAPPSSRREGDRSLALIVAGLYRTNNVTCSSHVSQLIAGSPHFSRVDVFADVLLDDTDLAEHNRTAASVEAALRACYGGSLRAVAVAHVRDVEEAYPGGEEAAAMEPCGRKLRRLNNQLRTLERAARGWWAWSVERGQLHDTVMRIRPDTKFWGGEEERPRFRGVAEMGDALVLPHPKGEHYFYCARMSGRVGVGPTDQIAYGSPSAMLHWLGMHAHFADMVSLASNPSRPALRDFSGCEVLPSGPDPADCPAPAPCSIECLVAWFLEARGVRFEIEWGWNQGLLRMEAIAEDKDAKAFEAEERAKAAAAGGQK